MLYFLKIGEPGLICNDAWLCTQGDAGASRGLRSTLERWNDSR
jgi:hypothetical protein